MLDADYGYFDDYGDNGYQLSETANDLFNAFKNQVIEEYPVRRARIEGEPIKVFLGPLLDDDEKK